MTDREPLRRLLALYREGRIGEEELLARLAPEPPADEPAAGSPAARIRAELAHLLDRYRAAEQSGADTIRAWAETTSDSELRGALRVVAAREAAHAQLLEARVRELGREPSEAVPDWLARFNASLLDESRSDADRLRYVVERLPDVADATAALRTQIDRIHDDVLTRELLRTIADDEELTLRWFHQAWARYAAGR